jgi:hypothetical protein
MRNLSICMAAAALLAPAAAGAQNKCIDPDGKITYQREACPRFDSSGPSRPAPAADAATMAKCAGDWETYADGMKRARQQAERRRQGGGGEMSKGEKKEQQTLEEGLARFLPACGRFGFEAPTEPRAEVRNNNVAKDLRRKTGTKPAGDARKP